jgi:hypothetical protein
MIIRKILEQCEKGNTALLIFAAKNLCGWVDRVISPTEAREIILNYKIDGPEVKRIKEDGSKRYAREIRVEELGPR